MNRLTLEEKASMTLYNSPAIERLGIPEYNWWNEALHGVARAGKATVFPQAIGMAATFDEDLIERVSSAIADEARAKHNAAKAKGSYQQYTGLSFWTPNVNIYRDPRWGRGQETWGEDPYLTSMMGVAFVKGLQGDDPNHLKAAACAKHFAVHNGPEKTRHEFNAIPSEIDFHETYLPAFEALVKNGVAGVMCAYNQVYGSPCCGNTPLLKTILREQWGFDGYIVSDCWALSDFISFQKIVPDATDAAAMAVKAGVNLNCGTVYKSIPEAIKEGKITESELDAVLWPLLKTRIKLGLLDVGENLLYADIGPEVPGSEEHRQLAYEAAVKSVVLLKNKNQCLPLDLNEIHKIYVTGPTAADNAVLLGNYNGLSGQLVTLLEGIIQKVDAGTVVDYSMGALLNTDSVYHGIYHAGNSDVIIASIGNSRLLEGEEGDAMLSKSGGDRADIKLPENQVEFIRKLRQAGPDKKLIVVINGGGAIAFPEINDLADAVLFAWYPGEQGGKAIADLIFGDQNPSGRLPVTFYADTEDLPPFEDYSMKYRTYRYFSGEPLYAFGHGLSYTSFEYSDLKTNAEVFSTAEQIEVSLRISNSGNYEGEEVVQLYVKDTDPGPDRPIKSLKGIKRVFLKPGESQKVTFIIPLKDLRHWNTDIDEWKLNRGVYGIEVGASSVDIRQTISVKVIR
ncbi:MAG: glycoside hydrolase family 3 C-terminal domain-containing protein [Bacteroidales bacterium]|nr:glycoside hydrolase family 3 C-terminal domain-containing protein [Bacteroidales bacterium]MCF8403954.1 glycoside hydrolase family 3 C-terminal domain-containing protein [Bacteroidales bacterium]